MRTTTVEGSCKVLVDIQDVPSRDQEVFFNPVMEVNRSYSILFLKAINKADMQIALPLVGSGVRLVRFVKELPDGLIKHIHVNDLSLEAIGLVRENLALNEISSDKVELFNLDANRFLEQSLGFDYIDIDPFGSPNFLLETSMRRVSRGGFLAVTATDTGALSGAFPSAGKFKYWAKTAAIPQKHELGLRILARKVILMGLHHGKVLVPVFSYHHEHYYRIFFRVTKSKTLASKFFDMTTSFFHHCPSCGFSHSSDKELSICSECGSDLVIVGPCFSGVMQDSALLQDMIALSDSSSLTKRLELLLAESKVDKVGFFDTHVVCEKHGGQAPKVSELIELLRADGFIAVKSSNEFSAVKTDCPYSVFVKKVLDMNKS